VEKWHDEVITAIQDDLKDLERENLNLLDEHISGFQEIIDNVSENNLDVEKINELTTLLDVTKIEIGEYSYE